MIPVGRLIVSAAALSAAFAAPAGAEPQKSLQRYTPIPGRTGLVTPIRSFAEMRFDRVVRQGYDLSCGAAALATVLTHYYGIPVGEREIIETVLNAVPADTRAKIGEEGFSMLELKRFAEMAGFAAGGFRLAKSEQLRSLKAPALALINSRGYAHFVVVKGMEGDEVLIADPAFGNRRRPLAHFAKEWNGVILVVVDSAGKLGDPSFRLGEDPQLSPAALQSILAGVGGVSAPRGANEF